MQTSPGGIPHRAPAERERAGSARAARGLPPWLPLALTGGVALLVWLALGRDWGPGARDLPFRGLLVVLLAGTPAVLWALRRRAGHALAGGIPFFPVIGLLFALYFGLPVLVRDDFGVDKLRFSTASLRTALDLAILGWLMTSIGWAVSGRWTPRLAPLRLALDRERSLRAAPFLLVLGVGAMLARRTMLLPGGFVQPLQFLELLFQVALGILVLAGFRGELPLRTRRIVWWGLVPSWLFLQIGQGAVAQVAWASVFLMFLAWGSGKRVPLATLATLAAALLLLRGHVAAFRSQTWHEQSPSAGAGLVERSTLFVGMLAGEFREDGLQAVHDATDQVYSRIAHVGELAHVVEATPREVPYWNGASFATLPTTLVPRLLWPDKPHKRIGQEFGHRYQLLHAEDRTTAINLPQLVEFYANFGTLGVALGMLLLGALYRHLDRWWNSSRSGDGTLLLAAILFTQLILIESDFTLVYGALLQRAVLLVLVLRLLASRRSASAALAAPAH